MTIDEAYTILVQVTGEIAANRMTHTRIEEALITIRKALDENNKKPIVATRQDS